MITLGVGGQWALTAIQGVVVRIYRGGKDVFSVQVKSK